MSAVAVAILTENDAQLPVLRARVEGTAIARTVLVCNELKADMVADAETAGQEFPIRLAQDEGDGFRAHERIKFAIPAAPE